MERNVTKYYFLYGAIITDIYSGKIKNGERLPALSEICDEYDIGRNTARMAIQLLEENGYVRTEPRKQAVVCFDLENPVYRREYLREMACRKQAVREVFDALELMMPDIFVYVLKRASGEARAQVGNMAARCADELWASSEQDLSIYLCRIYEKVLAFGKNELLNRMFVDMYQFIQLPLGAGERNDIRFKAVIPLIQGIFRKFSRQVIKEDYEGLKKHIRFFSGTFRDNSERRLQRICRGLPVEEARNFHWVPRLMGGKQYMLLAMELIYDICTENCPAGSLLPSYSSMAEKAGVSEKTSRKAVSVLSGLKAVSTINGVGRMVLPLGYETREVFMTDPDMEEARRMFREAAEIMAILSGPVALRALDNAAGIDLEAVGIKLNESVCPCSVGLSHFFFSHCASPVANEIYGQLKYMLIWGRLLHYSREEWNEKERKTAEEVLVKMKKKDKAGVVCQLQSFWNEICLSLDRLF